MARRCPNCLAPTKEEIIFHRRIEAGAKPQLYHYVRRYTCPEGCTAILDFSRAKKLRPGVTPMVLPKVERLHKESDFNDRLLVIGLGISLALFIAGILFIPTTIPIKAAAIGALGAVVFALYRFSTQRVILPESFPRPIPEPVIAEPEVETPAQAAATAVKEGPKKKAPPAEIVIPDVIPPLERKEGEPIKMVVILSDGEYEIEMNDGENMLDGALERNVEIDYSCREGMCDSCLVRILAGNNNITAPTQEEFDMLGEEEVAKGFRLACQVKVNGPVKIMQS